MKRILKNSIITPDGTELISHHVHDYKDYKDENGQYYAVDGGKFYLSRSYDKKDYTENSIVSDGTFELERKYLCWGRNYDKNMKLLPKTEFIPIKDLDTDHIWAILLNVKNIDKDYKKVFMEEICFREEQYIKEHNL